MRLPKLESWQFKCDLRLILRLSRLLWVSTVNLLCRSIIYCDFSQPFVEYFSYNYHVKKAKAKYLQLIKCFNYTKKHSSSKKKKHLLLEHRDRPHIMERKRQKSDSVTINYFLQMKEFLAIFFAAALFHFCAQAFKIRRSNLVF
jgi:hypothetical protein